MSELEIKTEFEIKHSRDTPTYDLAVDKRWVGLDSLKALLAEQRKENTKESCPEEVYEAKKELLVLLEERLK